MKPCYITPDQISKELQDIENKLNDLENEGVELEWRLRVYEEGLRSDVTVINVMAAFCISQRQKSELNFKVPKNNFQGCLGQKLIGTSDVPLVAIRDPSEVF